MRGCGERRSGCSGVRAPAPTSIEIHGAREHNLKNVDVKLGPQPIHRHHRRVGQRQEHPGLRHSICRRTAALPRIPERLCAAIRAARVAARRRRHLRHSAHRGHRAAHQPRRTQEHGGDSHRDLSLPAPALREAGGAVLPRLRSAASSRNPRTPSPRACSRTIAGKSIALLAPLIVARKGLYTALAKWARGKGFSHLRVDGELLPTAKWPRLDRFIEHNIELPIATLDGERRRARPNCAGRWTWHWSMDAAWCMSNCGRRAAPMPASSPPSAPARTAAPAFPNSIRGCSRSIRSTAGARAASAPDCNWRNSTPSRAARNPPGGRRTAQAEDGRPVACPDCAGQRLNPVAMHVLFRGQSIAALTDLPVQDFSAEPAKAQADRPRTRHRARLAGGTRGTHRLSVRCRFGLSAIEPRRTHALRRRGAAHSAGGAARIESAGRLLRSGRTDHRPAPARQRRAARHLGQAARQGQHPDRGRARRRHHSPRRSCDRSGSRRRHPRRPRGGARNGRGTRPHRAIPRPAAVSRRRCSIRAPGAAPSIAIRP